MATPVRKLVLNSGWIAAKADAVRQTGEELTTLNVVCTDGSDVFDAEEFRPGWIAAIVPGTILNTLVNAGVFPDPFYGLNNEEIPDIAHVGRGFYTYWFCTHFALPDLFSEGDGGVLSQCTRVWLQFNGINYSADVYLNGAKLVHPNPRGMFLRRAFDVTHVANFGGENRLAVLVHPPEHPGNVDGGGQGGDHDIAKDVTAQYVEGWDWIKPIRDRNTGIWDEVAVVLTGAVTLQNPHVVTVFEGSSLAKAKLHVSVEVTNASSAACHGRLTAQVIFNSDDDGFYVVEDVLSEEVDLEAGENHLHAFSPMLHENPQLWWPNGLGKQPLYTLQISFEAGVSNGAPCYMESDSCSCRFGFRKIETCVDETLGGGRRFFVNGHPLFIRGGNWIVSHGMLWLSRERYQTEVGFHADANLNMIRVWGGALAERPEFYDACDERGILVWQEFWITGDCNGRGVPPSDRNWPLDHELFILCVRDTVKMLRNHPSLAFWVGGNEQVPAEDVNNKLMKELRLAGGSDEDPSFFLDGTRPYFRASLWDGFASGTGAWSDGPYTIQNPALFFEETFYPYAFNPEIGSVGVPVAATIRATMPKESWGPPTIEFLPDDAVFRETPNKCWDYHCYMSYADKKAPYDHIATYGPPEGLDDFCFKAQIANYVQYRALIEGWNSLMWRKYSGVLIWKTQNPWPGLRGQLYDFLGDQTGGFFGVRCAAEPVHVQYNSATRAVEVVNTTAGVLSAMDLVAVVYSPEGSVTHRRICQSFWIKPATLAVIFKIPKEEDMNAGETWFLQLILSDKSGRSISRNFYWQHRTGLDFTALSSPWRDKVVPLGVTITCKNVVGERTKLALCLWNKTGTARGQSESPAPKTACSVCEAKKNDRPTGMQMRFQRGLVKIFGRKVVKAATEESSNCLETSQIVTGTDCQVLKGVRSWVRKLVVKDASVAKDGLQTVAGSAAGEAGRASEPRETASNYSSIAASCICDDSSACQAAAITAGPTAGFRDDGRQEGTEVGGGEGPEVGGGGDEKESEGGIALWIHLQVCSADRNIPVETVQEGESHASVQRSGDLGSDHGYVDNRVLPVRYSDNWICLVPAEHRTVLIEFKSQIGRAVKICMDGWNIERKELLV
ncbi:hypothetical protein CBR_g23107 [Chara braunii]|uniref:Beta-mannosidase n=1 Tax=Chara braunii TaxID=69332 RepID=A0A388L3W1_CHABU|nr:hypothetical protein CBR_g23107 [Chara braunii]|eukprot:GBG76893.1 hypothetical protein CBR_g23107 [Chara braunii]